MTALVVMVAPPGSGKTTYTRSLFHLSQIIHLDELRARVCDDQHNMDATSDAAALQEMLLVARCRRRLLTVMDSTNLGVDLRDGMLAHAHRNLMSTVAVVLDVPLEVCLGRNSERERPIPEDIVRRMHAKLIQTSPPGTPVDGFSQTVRHGMDGMEVFGPTPRGFEQPPWLLRW